MSDVERSSPLQRGARPTRKRGDHRLAFLSIFGLSLVVAVVLQTVALVIPLTILGAMIYGVCIQPQGG